MAKVRQHVECRKCGYDLFNQVQGEACPECGERIPRRQGLDRPKNPRRQAPPLRRELQRAQGEIWVGAVMLALSVAGLGATFVWFHNSFMVVALVSIGVSGVVAMLSGWVGYRDTRQRLSEVEWRIKHEAPPRKRATTHPTRATPRDGQ